MEKRQTTVNDTGSVKGDTDETHDFWAGNRKQVKHIR